MSTWVVVLIVVVVVVVVLAVAAGVRRGQKRRSAGSAMGLPPIGALSDEEPVVGPDASANGSNATQSEDPVQPRRKR